MAMIARCSSIKYTSPINHSSNKISHPRRPRSSITTSASESRKYNVAISGLPIALPFFDLPAHADTSVDPFTSQVQEAAAPIVADGYIAPDDPVISILFTIAIAALSVVTVGVAYLSLSTWNDSRQEDDDRRKSGGRTFIQEDRNRFTGGGSSSESESESMSRKKSPQTPKSSKGFGKK